jgi:hypothetical protein
MHLQDIATALKAATDVAHSGEELIGALDRRHPRSHIGSVLLGVGLGVGLGAMLFSEAARKRVQTWLFGAPAAPRGNLRSTIDAPVQARAERHDDAAPAH